MSSSRRPSSPSGDRRRRLQELFLAAADLPDDRRAVFLDEACEGDAALRAEVEKLLRTTDARPGFLDTPAVEAHGDWFDSSTERGASRDASDGSSERTQQPAEIGPYRVIRRLGEGGMGVVYLAEQPPPLRRRVAVKVIKPGMDSQEILARFDSERRAMARMNHSGIAKVFDSGMTASGRSFFAMEYVEGAPVTRFCDENALDLEARLRLFLEICGAVQHAHQKAFIHRDLKPTNILVTAEQGRFTPKVIDFGIAKALDPEAREGQTRITRSSRVVGTPEYMSPEQIDSLGEDVDTRADIYSLGVVLYELLVGTLPFDFSTRERKGYAHILKAQDVEAPRPTTRLRTLAQTDRSVVARNRCTTPAALLRDLKGDLEWILIKALDRDRTQRYASASEFASDIERFLEGSPVLATPPTALYRLSKFYRKHRTVVLTAAVVVLSLSVSLIVAIGEYRVSEQAREAAERALVERDAALRRSEGLRLTTQARLVADTRLETALVLALAGSELHPGRHADEALLDVLSKLVPYRELRGHAGDVSSVGFDPTGKILATSSPARASSDGTTCLWDVTRGDLLHALPGYARRIAFDATGSQIVTNPDRRHLRLWNTRTGEMLVDLGEYSYLHGAQFARRSRRLVACFSRNNARVFDLQGKEDPIRLVGHKGSVLSAFFDGEERRVVTGSRDRTWATWDARTGDRLLHVDIGKVVHEARFSPDGRWVGVSDALGRLIIFDATSGQKHREWLIGGGPVMRLGFSQDSRFVTSASRARRASVYEIASGERVWSSSMHHDAVNETTFSPDGTVVLTASSDRTARLWSADDGVPLAVLRGHGDRVNRALFSPSGEAIVTTSRDGTARLWDRVPVLDQLSFRAHTGRVYYVAFSPSGDYFVTCSRDGWARVWKTVTREIVSEYRGHDQRIYRVLFTADETRCISSSSEPVVRVWELSSGREVHALRGHRRLVMPLALSPDDTVLASGSEDDTVRLWSLQSGAELSTLAHDGRVDALDFNRHGTLLLTGSWDDRARVWRVPDGELVSVMKHDDRVRSVRFVGDGARVVTASEDRVVRVWNARTGELLRTLTGHEGGIVDLAVSDSGERVVSASHDGTLRIWTLDSGEPGLVLRGHEGDVVDVEWSHDGHTILSGSHDGTARLWDAATGRCKVVLSGHGDRVLSVAIDPQGRWLATGSEDHTARFWPRDWQEFARRLGPRELTESERELYRVDGELLDRARAASGSRAGP